MKPQAWTSGLVYGVLSTQREKFSFQLLRNYVPVKTTEFIK